MGVLCVAPDASAGGGLPGSRVSVARGRELIAAGADILEIACASAVPGRRPVHPVVEARQVRGVVSALMNDVRVAVRTGSPAVAAAAVGAGATLLSEVSTIPPTAQQRGSLAALAAEAGIGWVAVQDHGGPHRRGGAGNGDTADPERLLGEVAAALRARIQDAEAAGVQEIYVDPGIGTGRAVRDDLELLGDLERLAGLERPLVVGTGDGRLVDALHAAADTAPSPQAEPSPRAARDARATRGAAPGGIPAAAGRQDRKQDRSADRLEGELAVAVWAMLAGAAVVRTHHVAATVEAARTVGAKPPLGAP